MLQLQIVQAVLRQARARGGVSAHMRRQAAALIEQTIIQVDPEVAGDGEFVALLDAVRAMLAAD